ncbi:MAG: POTRA domain-containing protein, partial [Bacteroidota bacterium]
FQVSGHENRVEGDSVDLVIRVVEGAQATVRQVTVKGNDKTSDHVIMRELRTRPGQKFSRSDVMRTTRELSQLGYFDPEQLGVVPTPNPQDGTVDIEYKVAERSNDQVELSGGWGAGQVVGSLGLVLNNFSARKMFDPKAWSPVPGGDGQRVSVRAQSNGRFFQSYNLSFTEPWLG